MRSTKPPVLKTRKQIEKDLLRAMRGILSNCVTTKALANPSKMTLEDIHQNLHLWERLGEANAALGALRDYRGTPRGYSILGDN